MNDKKQIPVECYSRISGYMRPTMQWNAGKKAEFAERKMINIEAFKNNTNRV